MTLPNVFNNMAGGRLVGSLFFLFMSFVAVSTVIAVFQNIVSFATDLTGCTIKRPYCATRGAVILLSPAVCWDSICGAASCHSAKAAMSWI